MRGDGSIDEGGVAHGGRTVYGARVGILMLETQFPRILGDLGNAHTWDFPVTYRVVRGASARRVVGEQATGLESAFVDSAKDLVRDGVDGITTSCGFLSLLQSRLAEECQVPVATSALLQVPWVNSLLPPQKHCGIVTASADALTPAHLSAVNVPLDTPIVGIAPESAFAQTLLGDGPTLDVRAAAVELTRAAQSLLDENPSVGALVLECTNMGPYARVLRERLGIPVFDIISLIRWFHSGLEPQKFV
jgi:Asp/Glu/hydantoin racemase